MIHPKDRKRCSVFDTNFGPFLEHSSTEIKRKQQSHRKPRTQRNTPSTSGNHAVLVNNEDLYGAMRQELSSTTDKRSTDRETCFSGGVRGTGPQCSAPPTRRPIKSRDRDVRISFIGPDLGASWTNRDRDQVLGCLFLGC
ncbi:hypothetical protein JTE90_009564 [Oedothorax gibbosus]|uniref:Uncharacterized protein n=1 Tax=Oedothorax gibbosus TaxID=931172 RepID=A0AAV6UZH2_9ARAC|nr:hypothetical protein JTE90_009564 [Oedothorax gibbosus]